MAQRYAFGDTKVRGTACVAKSVSADLEGELLTVAEAYDDVARERLGRDEGTVTESTARECWDEAIGRIENRLQVERDPDHARYLRRAIGQAEDVRNEAFN